MCTREEATCSFLVYMYTLCMCNYIFALPQPSFSHLKEPIISLGQASHHSPHSAPHWESPETQRDSSGSNELQCICQTMQGQMVSEDLFDSASMLPSAGSFPDIQMSWSWMWTILYMWRKKRMTTGTEAITCGQGRGGSFLPFMPMRS